jgi:tetratricopeptide (TPR) repeat protein
VSKILQFVAIACFSLLLGVRLGAADLEQAMDQYTQAEAATDKLKQQTLFNEAMKTFLEEAKTHPSGKLFYNIGNIYAYLGDYGSAIAFYRKAEKDIPRDPALKMNLNKVLELAGVAGYQIQYPVLDTLALRQFSPMERELLLLGLATFSLVLFSLNVWFSSGAFKWLSGVAIAVTLLLIIVLVSYHLFLPPRAVVVKATPLYITQLSSTAARFTLRPGEMVEVIDKGAQKGLIHIKTATSVTGYVPEEVICVI